MSKGFFHPTKLQQVKQPATLVPACGACGLYKKCETPKIPPMGKGQREILVVSESPGKDEDESGGQRQTGNASERLRREMREIGIDFDRDCWRTNSLICHPENNKTPTDSQIEHCRPNLMKTISRLKPKVILLLGGAAMRSLLAPLWKPGIGAAARWRGWKIPSQKINAWVCPTFNPAHLEREGNPVLDVWFKRHLEAALSLNDRPWQKVPDYVRKIEIILDPSQAARWINEHRRSSRSMSFDYETTHLKPDSEAAEIYTCSVCFDGKNTAAFPWHGDAIDAMSSLLKSDIPKLGWNMKFEQRWTRAKMKHGVRNWKYDGMLGTHWIDTRRQICSLDFQSFIRLGMPDYDSHIKPYLKSTVKAGPNKIRELDLRDLLVYNGIDSLLEHKIGMMQMKETGLWV